jgi:hypothetical protein
MASINVGGCCDWKFVNDTDPELSYEQSSSAGKGHRTAVEEENSLEFAALARTIRKTFAGPISTKTSCGSRGERGVAASCRHHQDCRVKRRGDKKGVRSAPYGVICGQI